MADKKLFRVIKALLVSVCIMLCSATAVACKSCKKKDTDVESGEFPSITFTSAAEAYVGEYYKLEMVLPQGVTAEIITAKSSWTTPSNCGKLRFYSKRVRVLRLFRYG